jgi:hypothetical protein
MEEDWNLGPKQSHKSLDFLPKPTSKRPPKNENPSPAPALENGAVPILIELLKGLMEKAENHYMMISGQLDHLSLALDAHMIGPYADPEGYIVNRLVKPDHRLEGDLDPTTQLKLLAWLYRLHDPRLKPSLAAQRALETLQGK